MLQHPITKFIFLHLSHKTRLKLSGQLRKKSTEAQQYKSHQIMDIIKFKNLPKFDEEIQLQVRRVDLVDKSANFKVV
jgi:hypothetical protein